jgi:hypothetical protein
MSKRLRWLHANDSSNLFWISIDSPLEDEITQELASWHTEGALFRVEHDVVAIEVGESFTQVIEQAVCFRGLDSDIVDIYFDVASDLLL